VIGANMLLLAQDATRVTFEWGRIQTNSDWILPIVAMLFIALFVRAMYTRDAQELPHWIGLLLTALRTAAFLGLLVLYLQPQWRTEHETIRNSRVLLLVDSSSSMGLTDAEPSSTRGESRAHQVAQAMAQNAFLLSLRKTHDVVVMRFDEDLGRIVSLDKSPLPAPQFASTDSAAATQDNAKVNPDPRVDWEKALSPVGKETRLGQALRQLIYEERNSPVSGIVVFSDGGQNAGLSPEAAISLAQEAKIPIYTVGVGSDQLPMHVRVYKLETLPRAYPGDPYTITGLIQAQDPSRKLAGKPVTVQLLTRKAGEKAAPGSGTLVDSRQVILGGDGESVPVKFEITPKETGRQVYCLRVESPPGDRDPHDNFREAEVEVVDRKDRVLLLAGGPTREYGFLRPLLFRDKSMVIDILLETAQPGISQEANKILDRFPSTREELYSYDCIVAFDPNWKALSQEQIDLLEGWVAEQAGGLVVVAGPVYMGEAVNGWVQDPAMAKIRALYPVEFQRRVSVLETSAPWNKEPWPLDFTREGLEAQYVWLADTETANQQAWASFPGVYSYYPVRGPKSAATVLARFSDPRTGQAGERPVYLAEQFYGSGRVFYLGSGEMWRLRQVDEGYFERLYTRLIRHVAQGRLLRQSSRGVLMVGQDQYQVGGTVEIRAQLTNAQLAPLVAQTVPLQVFQPGGKVQTITLRPDPSRIGTYAGQFTALDEGDYRMELLVPESTDERLTRRIQVSMPDVERQNPQRNAKLLTRIADGTQGKYYADFAAAINPQASDPLVNNLKDRTKTVVVTAAPDPQWEQTWMRWLMYTLAGLLFVEWTIRRLLKLA
jgi:hypothetical protein